MDQPAVEVVDMLTLRTMDGSIQTVPKEIVAKHSLFLQAVLQDKEATSITLDTSLVTGTSLALIIEYMLHHTSAEVFSFIKPLEISDFSLICTNPWDIVFINNLHISILTRLLLAVHYLNVPSLYQLCLLKFATLVRTVPLSKLASTLRSTPHI